LPVGNGLTLDFGKWSSSLGIENNYAKDQMNYSRSYWFDFLPFYHMGLRANYKFNDRISGSYWLVNGTNQVEAFNGFKDQLVGLTLQPHKNVNWTINYYLGQEHPDITLNLNPGSPTIASQSGLSITPIIPAPNGKLHIFDSYASWQSSAKMTFALEGDYVIERLWQDASFGRSSAPSHVIGGAAYARYQLTPRTALAARAEYLSDRGGLFSGRTQALKETTLTYDFKVANGFIIRPEWRRDFSNQPFFLTDIPNALKKSQNTGTIGVIWWWGNKEGSW
jgi:Putative beta-barrel porin-2, OmpL-like. bbp2